MSTRHKTRGGLTVLSLWDNHKNPRYPLKGEVLLPNGEIFVASWKEDGSYCNTRTGLDLV